MNAAGLWQRPWSCCVLEDTTQMQVGHDKARKGSSLLLIAVWLSSLSSPFKMKTKNPPEVAPRQPFFAFFKRKFMPRCASHFWNFGDESQESVNHFGKSVFNSRLKTTICYFFCIILLKYTFKYHLHVTDHVTSDLCCQRKTHDSRNLDRSTLVKGRVYTLRDT